MMQNWNRVGKIKDAKGLKGELYVLLFAKEAAWIEDLHECALATSDQGPFEIHTLQTKKIWKDGLLIQIPGVQDRTQAESKKGLLFYIPAELLVSKPGEAIYLHEIEGFQVVSNGQNMGPITGFSSNGAQDLLEVEHQGRKYLVPFVEAFLLEIDFETKTVHMDLPEGLFE